MRPLKSHARLWKLLRVITLLMPVRFQFLDASSMMSRPFRLAYMTNMSLGTLSFVCLKNFDLFGLLWPCSSRCVGLAAF